ncbi:MAG: carbohydrate ABC transporter permease [Lachnospiraceae bacterium]|nr:carbohydrate ABC transporter permease [Lachnospiraceae bacterium]
MLKIRWFKGQWLHITFSKVLLYLVMLALVCFTALPLVYLVSTAFKPLDELFVYPPRFFVHRPTTKNFTDLVVSLGSSTVPFTRYFFNSVIVTVVIVVGTVIVSSMGAYSLVKFKPPGGQALFNLILIALMFSAHVTKIPSYMVVNKLHLINTYGALILPNLAVAYNCFLIKQFMEQYPDELIEAARIDGAGEFRIFLQMVMPALKPATATLVVFSFTSNWNDYFSPLIYVTSQAMKTLPLALQTISGGAAGMTVGRAGAVAAATFLMTLPTVIIFTVMQGKVMETMVYSGIKE